MLRVLASERVMTVLVYIIGALLVLAGAVFISMGVPIVRLEIGWSEVIGGAVAGSAGFVILAVGVVLTRLEELRRAVLGLNMTAVLRESFAEPEPAWEEQPEQPERVLAAPHPLAPATTRPQAPFSADTLPSATSHSEPVVVPEPPLAEAPLHPEEAEDRAEPALPVVSDPAPAPDLSEGAPALLADEDHAPPLPPVEALPPEALTEPAEEETAPPSPSAAEPSRGRPNFLAAFLARRSAAVSAAGERAAASERTTPRFDRPSIEPTLVPLRTLESGEAPARTPIDLSSGWGEAEPAHHIPSGMADEPPVSRPDFPSEEAEPVSRESADVAEPPLTDTMAGAAAEPALDFAEPEPEPREHTEPPAEEPAEPSEPEPLKPLVVGRYNAGSASYIMYSNGMIEVETEGGTHQFASMQELKAFIERRDAAKV